MFERYNLFIKIAVTLLGIFPKKILILLYDLSSIFSGTLAIGLRYCILKNLVNSCGDNVYIGKSVTIKNFNEIMIGSNVSIHDFSYLDGLGGLYIGDNVSIAHNSSILTTTHTWEDAKTPIKYNQVIKKPVVIEDDVWVGCGVRIINGVRIESRSIIAAASVVNRNVESNAIYAGVPAKKIKNIGG